MYGLTGGDITGEPGIRADLVEDDAVRIRTLSGSCRVALPAPHRLELVDRYFGDEDEASAALFREYRHLFRAMRDAGVAGHVLHCDKAIAAELEVLAGNKVFFFLQNPDRDSITTLLEYQHKIAVSGYLLPLVLEQREEYEIRQVFLMDPTPGNLQEALHSLDPEQVMVGGYCMEDGPDYWRSLVDSATLSL